MKVAILLSCSSFESFFGRVLGQTRRSYLDGYRNDFSWYYAGGLLANGIEPVLYIPSVRETGLHETDAGVPVRFLKLSGWYAWMEGRWRKRLARATRFSLYADERFNAMAFLAPLRDAIRADGVDVLYVQEYWSGRFDHLVGRVGVPVVAADHGGLSDKVLKFAKRRAFAGAAMVYCQTSNELGIAKAYGPRATLLPNGCDTATFNPDPAAERGPTVLTVARLTNRQKRTTDLIAALTLLPDEWSLDIVGTGPDLSLLQAQAAELGVSSRVRFHGFLGRTEIRDMMRRCGAFCMPSSNEAVAIAALEAMGCGAPMVLSRIRAFERLVSDGVDGRLAPVGDPAALASAILEAYGKRDVFSPAAVEKVRSQFDAHALYRQLAGSLREAAAR
jgi:glycosyltransferase involved in cell wall biosynthesis